MFLIQQGPKAGLYANHHSHMSRETACVYLSSLTFFSAGGAPLVEADAEVEDDAAGFSTTMPEST
jgi:hypothetical protein